MTLEDRQTHETVRTLAVLAVWSESKGRRNERIDMSAENSRPPNFMRLGGLRRPQGRQANARREKRPLRTSRHTASLQASKAACARRRPRRPPTCFRGKSAEFPIRGIGEYYLVASARSDAVVGQSERFETAYRDYRRRGAVLLACLFGGFIVLGLGLYLFSVFHVWRPGNHPELWALGGLYAAIELGGVYYFGRLRCPRCEGLFFVPMRDQFHCSHCGLWIRELRARARGEIIPPHP